MTSVKMLLVLAKPSSVLMNAVGYIIQMFVCLLGEIL